MPILNGAQLLARTRRLVDDQVEPYYFADAELYIWITEAERSLAEVGGLLRDMKSYTVAENDRWKKIGSYPEVHEFKRAVLVDSSNNRYGLRLLGAMDSEPVVYDDDDYGIIPLASQLTAGRPEALIFGKRTGYFELSPPANDSYTIEAYREIFPYPIEEADDEPTISERHHQAIPIGAAVLAMEGSEDEHFTPRVNNLQGAWARALARAEAESTKMNRDSGLVHFQNDLWGMPYVSRS